MNSYDYDAPIKFMFIGYYIPDWHILASVGKIFFYVAYFKRLVILIPLTDYHFQDGACKDPFQASGHAI